jgi:hypothetical protein
MLQSTGLTFALTLVLLTITSAVGQSAQQDAIKQTIAVLEKRLADNPGDATWKYFLAVYYARADRKDDAFAMLEKLVGRPTGLLATEEIFPSLARDPRFAPLAAKLEKTSPKLNRGAVAFRVKQISGEEILPEGIAYDDEAKRWFLGDAHHKRVYIVDAAGQAKIFAALPLIPLGMKVDRARNALWIATYSGDFVPAEKKEAALEKLDLRTGKRIARYQYPGAKLFNDIALASNGDLYITDSERGSVLRLLAKGEKLEEFIPPDSLRYPNGIAISTNGRNVFVAQSTGIVVAETATKKFARLNQSVDTISAGIDGLYFHDGALIGVQNGISPHRVTRFRLNEGRDSISGVEVLESRSEHFLVPTTGAIADDVMFVLANAQLGQLTDKGTVRDPKTLRDLVILRLPLQR